MLRQFYIASLRYLARNKGITAINITGLTFGITFSILIGLYVKRELSIDLSYANGDRIYRLEFDYHERGRNAVMVSAVGPDLRGRLSGIDKVLRLQFWEDIVLKKDAEDYYNIPKVCVADSSFFDFFEQTWLYGSPENALNKPLSIVLTDELSYRIFGDVNPVGLYLLSQSGDNALPVTGVIKKRNDTHFNYDALLSMITRSIESPTILNTYSTQQWLTYFLLGEGVNAEQLEGNIYNELLELVPSLKDETGNRDFSVLLNPLKDIYFDRQAREDGVIHGNYSLVLVFLATAVLIIIIACINFINLSTARAMKRAREVGLRKLAGSDRKTLISQFMTESLIISVVSTLIAVVLAELLLPYFNNLTGNNLDIKYLDNPYTIPALISIIAITGILAGLYPAYYISTYKAIDVIKGEITSGRRSLGFRRGLILFKFLISVILISGSLLISRQMRYTREKDVGFEKERILTVNLTSTVERNRDNVRERLLQNPEILNVSYSYTIPGSRLNYEAFRISDRSISTMVFSIDPHYVETLGLEIIAGRNFDEKISTDSVSHCIINETLAGRTGLEDPLNASFLHDSWYITMFPVKNIRIIGIVRDFHFKSFRNVIEPLILAWNPGWFNFMNIKIAEGEIGPAMEKIRKILDEFDPGVPMEYQFVDESFDMMYKSDERMGMILVWFTLLAILISVLGLIGMAMFMAEQKTKETAILRTYGASVTSVLTKLSREFILLVIIANLIGWPVVLWLGSKWLDDFVYKTSIDPMIFITGAIISILITVITVISVIWKTATSNPADSLRYE